MVNKRLTNKNVAKYTKKHIMFYIKPSCLANENGVLKKQPELELIKIVKFSKF